MKFVLTSQQTAFFTQNGHIEFDMDFDSTAVFDSALHALKQRTKSNPPSAIETYANGRDLWRNEPVLQHFLLRKLAPVVHGLLGKKAVRLACDQWIPAGLPWEKALPPKDLFSIQGLTLGLLICRTTVPLPTRSPLGLLPLPAKAGNLLLFQPRLILDWPSLAKAPATDLYFAAYAQPNSVYVQNLKDPATNFLKQFGYGFGDGLKNEFHPLLGL